jgi:hypothetical protein
MRGRAMSPWLSEVLKVAGLITPALYAVGVYRFFRYLDKRASKQAKDAIAGWLRRLKYNEAAVAAATVEVFDRLYTRPLLGWRAFVRSMLFTFVMIVIFIYEVRPLFSRILEQELGIKDLWASIVANVVSDYLSLFVVRRWLVIGGKRPLLALFTGLLVGAFVIYVVNIICQSVWLIYNLTTFGVPVLSAFQAWFRAISNMAVHSIMLKVNWFLVAAFAIHFWLPLFALGVVFVHAINWFILLVSKTQWFLKKGQEHPLEAIGWVAAAIVFLISVVARHLS